MKKHDGFVPLRCHIQVGALSGINPESLEAAIPMVIEGSAVEKTEFHVSMEPVECRCRYCGAEIRIDEFTDLLICESCGSSDFDCPESAQKIYVTRIELEKDGEVLTIDLEDAEVEEEEHNH